MRLSDRLKAIVNEIKYKTLADIGTDHGLVPIYAIKNGIINNAIATDISKGSLEKAIINIKYYGLTQKIETRLCDGLNGIKENEAETIVIAGMGGLLMCDILLGGRLASVKQFILQPQKDVPSVRKCIHSLGFKIQNELLIFEDGIYYNIINCQKGNEDSYTENEYKFGKLLILNKPTIFLDYLNDLCRKLNHAKSKITADSLLSQKRLYEIDGEILCIQEVLNVCKS